MPFQSETTSAAEARLGSPAEAPDLHELDSAAVMGAATDTPATSREELNFPDIFPVYPFIV
jgi:hypothetical protein